MAKIADCEKGVIIQLNRKYPVWNFAGYHDGCDEDKCVGYTSTSDIGIITSAYPEHRDKDLSGKITTEDKDKGYIEIKILSGEFAGYDALAINTRDYFQAKVITTQELVEAYQQVNQILVW